MFKNQFVNLIVSAANFEHLEKRGYEIEKTMSKNGKVTIKRKSIRVKVEDLPINSHAIVEVECFNCGNIIKKEYRNAIKGKNFCDIKCKGEHQSVENLKSLEKLLGEDAYSYFQREYVTSKKTLRQISINLYGHDKNFSALGNWIKVLGIPLRHGSEAIKTQWINNDNRKRETSNRAKINLNSKASRDKLRISMSTDAYKEKQRVSKLGEKNGMYGVIKEKNHKWNPNKTHDQRVKDRKTHEVSSWRKNVFERDEYKCKCCGYDKGNILVAHHLYSYHDYPNLRTDVNNGITLCDKCHKEFHGIFGYGKNTKEQFDTFIKTR